MNDKYHCTGLAAGASAVTLKVLVRLQFRCTLAWMTWRGQTWALSQRPAGALGECSPGRALGQEGGRTLGAWEKLERLCRKPWSCLPNTLPL